MKFKPLLQKTNIKELHCETTSTQIDIMAITESWLSTKSPDSIIRLENYSIYRTDRNLDSSSGEEV